MAKSANNAIGVYGGSFDPVHCGHLRTALEVKEIFALEQLRLLPCYQSPLKSGTYASAIQRQALLQAAIHDVPGIICDSRELDRPGPSYMVDTLASLRAEFPLCPLLLFIGTDAFNQLPRWHKWQQLFDFAHIVVMTRPALHALPLNDFLAARQVMTAQPLTEALAGRLFFQAVTQLDISATAIRALIAQGRNPQFLLPETVMAYIRDHQLYKIV
jgi:nicotinate-nucleotide adenylyltransferase